MARSAHQRTAGAATSPVDVAVGASAVGVAVAVRVGRKAGSALRPVAHVALHPPGVPDDLRPARWVGALARIGADRRTSTVRELSGRLDALVPAVLTEVLGRARLTEMVLRYVDLDAVVAAVDLDAAAARLSVDDVVRRVDVDAIVDRVDVDAILDRVDLTSVVLQRVDLDALLTAVLDRMDLTAVVLQRVDLEALVGAALDQLDLTSVVLDKVDLKAVVDAALAKVDLVGIAEEVIDGVDLPEIIRESTGSMASDTVRGVRMQGIVADEAVGRAVDRLLLRRGRRATEAPGSEATAASLPTAPPDEARIPTQSDRTR
jgi:hypothetical protein